MKIARAYGVWAALFVFAILVLPAAAPGQTQARRASPELAALVPGLDGWALSEAPRSYFPDDLFEYINGAAESYLSYDFRELIVADFEKKGADATLTVEIYDMGGAVNAFGIFGSESYPENGPVAIGDIGYAEDEALNFLASRYYVKLLGFGLGESIGAVLRDVGARVAGAVKTPGGLPALVRAFPADNLVARSEKYIKKNFMGYAFLHDGYVAAYRAGARELEGFFIEGESEKDAEAMLAALLEALAADGQAPSKIALGARARNRYGQHLFVGRVGRVLCGAMRVPDGLEEAGESLLRALTMSLAANGAPK
jgi:hypothetical protein